MSLSKLGELKREKFTEFEVHIIDDKYSFFHINISNSSFYNDLFNYFFNEEKLLKYAENKTSLDFSPNLVNYTAVFNMIEHFIDSENIKMDITDFDNEIKEILMNENEHEHNKIGNLILRLDKIGKIGEYLFSHILWEYFKFDCIIPKVHLSTDPNMNVYGIDTIFYSSSEDLLMFGESKLTKNINNGVKLIKKSLNNYEEQLVDEYRLVLNNRIYKNLRYRFDEIYGEISERCVNIYEFIEEAKIQKIGIPIFIAHGNEKEINEIIKAITSIKKRDFFGLKTIYYFISLPIISKDELITIFTAKIRERRSFYGEKRNRYRSTSN